MSMTGQQPANPWLNRGVFHWAHQGGAKEAPSNTLRAMRTGVANKAHGLEFDVHRSADGQIVLIHDDTIDRTTDQKGPVAAHSAAELAGFDAAYWWVPGQVDNHDPKTPKERFTLRGRVEKEPDLGIPTLDQVLDSYGDLPMTIEVKVKEAAAPLVELLRARHIPPQNLIVTSFRDDVVDELHRLDKDLPLAPGSGWTFRFLAHTRLHLPLPARGPYVALQVPHKLAYKEIPQIPSIIRAVLRKEWKLTVVTPRFVRAAHRVGLAVHVWTIDEVPEMRQLIHMGVDGIMTDKPSELTRVLGDR
jgi:glycerophosphoryl diester phosphodiesterase